MRGQTSRSKMAQYHGPTTWVEVGAG
eukprot:SAG11_NODE_27632_length_330_cov_2.121212_2_plen_25_part_01